MWSTSKPTKMKCFQRQPKKNLLIYDRNRKLRKKPLWWCMHKTINCFGCTFPTFPLQFHSAYYLINKYTSFLAIMKPIRAKDWSWGRANALHVQFFQLTNSPKLLIAVHTSLLTQHQWSFVKVHDSDSEKNNCLFHIIRWETFSTQRAITTVKYWQNKRENKMCVFLQTWWCKLYFFRAGFFLWYWEMGRGKLSPICKIQFMPLQWNY